MSNKNFLDANENAVEKSLKFIKNEVEDDLNELLGVKSETPKSPLAAAPPRDFKVVLPKADKYDQMLSIPYNKEDHKASLYKTLNKTARQIHWLEQDEGAECNEPNNNNKYNHDETHSDWQSLKQYLEFKKFLNNSREEGEFNFESWQRYWAIANIKTSPPPYEYNKNTKEIVLNGAAYYARKAQQFLSEQRMEQRLAEMKKQGYGYQPFHNDLDRQNKSPKRFGPKNGSPFKSVSKNVYWLSSPEKSKQKANSENQENRQHQFQEGFASAEFYCPNEPNFRNYENNRGFYRSITATQTSGAYNQIQNNHQNGIDKGFKNGASQEPPYGQTNTFMEAFENGTCQDPYGQANTFMSSMNPLSTYSNECDLSPNFSQGFYNQSSDNEAPPAPPTNLNWPDDTTTSRSTPFNFPARNRNKNKKKQNRKNKNKNLEKFGVNHHKNKDKFSGNRGQDITRHNYSSQGNRHAKRGRWK